MENDLRAFIIELVRHIIDPISLIGYVLAGLLVRKYWGAVAVGVAWQSLVILLMVIWLAPILQESAPPVFSLAARLVGAFIATSLVYLMVGTIRKAMALPRICPECGIHNPSDCRWCECGYDLDGIPPLPRREPIVRRSQAASDDIKVVLDDAHQEDIEKTFSHRIVQKVRGQFMAEWTWRLFVSLQVLGILMLIYLNITDRSWSVLPRDGYRGLSWDLFEPRYWTYEHQNWLATTCLIAPFVVAKSIDWVVSARDQ